MASFLLISPRHGAGVIQAEYHDFLGATGLLEEELEQRVIDTADAQLGDISGFQGIFIGGSPLNMTDPVHDAWQDHVNDIIGQLADSSTPVLSLCYGAGALTAARGGKVGRTHPENSGPTVVELSAAAADDPLFSQLPATFQALTGHTENIVTPSPESIVLATGPTCPYQAIRFGDHVWACQFHAEMDAFGMETRMSFYRGHGYFSDDEYDAIVRSLAAVDTTYSRSVLSLFVDYCRKQAL